MWLIVGLGNPGLRYQCTRHNIGFLVIENFLTGAGSPPTKKEHKAITSKFRMDDQNILLACPQTYMNLSGESVRALMDYYKVADDQVLVIHDDIDQPFGGMKFQKSRGAGGHNGIKSLNQHLETTDYARLKLGVGRPPNTEMDVADYVLQDFSKSEQPALGDFLNRSSDAVETYIFEGFQKAANQFNKTRIEDREEEI